MNTNYLTSAFLILIVAVILYSVYYALNYCMDKLNLNPKDKSKALGLTFLALFAWLGATGVLAATGFFADFKSLPPKILVSVIPPALAIGYLISSTRVNSLISVMPKTWMIYIQSYRILVELFLLWMFLAGTIPVQMTFEGRNYDIIIGLTAPLIAYFSYTKKSWPKIIPLLWNAAGILLVTNIFIIALLSTPSPLRKFFNEPANAVVAYFPYIWLPALIVPFAYLMHLLSIKQIMRYDGEDNS